MRSTRPTTQRSAEAVRSAAHARDELRRKARAENFPVALRVLPARYRTHLGHLYDVARVIDDLGDTGPPEHRTAALLAFKDDLATIWHGGTPQEAVLRNLAETVRSCRLPEQPFLDLIETNLRDQTTPVYDTYEQLVEYCRFSANPVGRLVLDIFGEACEPNIGPGGVRTSERVALSDKVCTALQIIEHCQDVAEDHRAGRRYLPRTDLDRFGVTRADLEAGTASPALRRLVRVEAERAEATLIEGAALLAQLQGWARLAIAGYIAGGRAAVVALRRADWNVLPTPPRRRRRDVAGVLATLWLQSRAAPVTVRPKESQ